MADVIWTGTLRYESQGLTHGLYQPVHIPILRFSAKGVDAGSVDLTIPRPVGSGLVWSELSTARNLKNITVFAELTDNWNGVFDLLEIAARNLPVSMEFSAKGHMGTSLASEARLVSTDARIPQPQDTSKLDPSGKRSLRVRFTFSNAMLL
jgi:hypothetical protein